jgi:hypothetical protein
MRLTPTQDEALLVLLDADPNPVRGGMGTGGCYRKPGEAEQINSTTGTSLVGHGLLERTDRPAGAKRGAWFRLTPAGRDRAEQIRHRQWRGGR